MNIFELGSRGKGRSLGRQAIGLAMGAMLLMGTWPESTAAFAQDQDQTAPAQDQSQPPQPQYAPQTADQLQQLVAPIALYPDSLVAQILAAATYPEQVVEADRWVQANPDLKGDDLAKAVDQQPWDPSVKALTGFPSVLANMDKNLSWTSSLGDAYYNQQQDVMDAIQTMRQKAQQAGTLQSTPQQTVNTQGSTIVIQPAQPTVVYVPAYDPWVVYGYPVAPWPGWYPYPGIWYGGPSLFFGVGFGIGYFGGYPWGWGGWGFDWGRRTVIYNRNVYYSRSPVFYNRNNYYRGGGPGFHGGPGPGGRPVAGRPGEGPGGAPGRPGGEPGRPVAGGGSNRPGGPQPFGGNDRAARGFAPPQGQSNVRSGAFSGYGNGGDTRGFSSRGSQSFGGGGGYRGGGGFGGGGGGFHGGGGGGRPR